MHKFIGIGLMFFQVVVLSTVSKTTKGFGSKTMACTSNPFSNNLIKDFKKWQLSPCKLLKLPIETIRDNSPRFNIPNVLFSYVKPTSVFSPKLVAYSKDVLTNILDLDVSVANEMEFVQFISGNRVLNSSNPIAHRYGGHQFGIWAEQLGDGRALILGEYLNRAGERWELQLKGSGQTPYSRGSDGRAVLRSSVREFLCSEAMHYLGVPTSRAGALVISEDTTVRDPLYNGNPILEKLAVVLRLAPTWFRFGSFEILTQKNEIALLKILTDFVIKEHFPDIDTESEDCVLEMFSKVARLTSDLVLAWQAVGFTHGVMNTDNMSILGITIDYGPFGFMEEYDKFYVPNASDNEGRYSYFRQIEIALYNLKKLSEALAPLLSQSQRKHIATILLAESNYLEERQIVIFSNKLGLTEKNSDIISLLMTMLQETNSDFTMVFRDLGELPLDHLDKPCSASNWALANLAKHEKYPQFLELYREFLKKTEQSDEQRRKKMCSINPRYILRNWIAQIAIKEAENKNFIEVERLLRILSKPFERQEEAEKMGFASPSPSWSKYLIVSCSS